MQNGGYELRPSSQNDLPPATSDEFKELAISDLNHFGAVGGQVRAYEFKRNR